MPSVWFLDCTFLPDLFTRHYCVRAYFPFEPGCLSTHPHSIHKCLGGVRGTAPDFPRSVLRQSNGRLLPFLRLLCGARYALRRRRNITRYPTFWIHSGACVELGGWIRSFIRKFCLQGKLFLSSLSFLDGPATQGPSQQCHLSPSIRLHLDHGKPVRSIGCPCVA